MVLMPLLSRLLTLLVILTMPLFLARLTLILIKSLIICFMVICVYDRLVPTVNTLCYIDHAGFLGTINPDTNKIPKHLFQGYLNIYNNYFKAPWMPDRTEANPNELNQDDARYGFRCCHLKNIWT